MTAVQSKRTNAYRENMPNNKYLSKTFQSSVLHTPSHTSRRTISTENYLRQIAKEFHNPPQPWGRKNSYGGRSFIHIKGTPTGHDMVIVAKGAKHFGSGISTSSRGAQVQQLYSITPNVKSKVRSNDEMIPAPSKIDLQTHQVNVKYPAEHPFKSHIPKNDIFPTTTNKSLSAGEDSSNQYIHPADSPAQAPKQTIHSKCRGFPYRHEEISIPLDSQRKPMTWPQGPTYQITKSIDIKDNERYPTPSTQYSSKESYPISKSTSDVLKEVNDSTWKTMYQKDFSRKAKSAVELGNKDYLSKEAKIISKLVQSKDNKIPNIIANDSGDTNQTRPNDDNKRLSRPVYKGPRSFTTSEHYSNVERILTQTPPRPSEIPSTEYTPISLEKTGLQRQFNTSHPKIQVPDLRVSRENRNLFFEKRHFIPEANGTKSYLIR